MDASHAFRGEAIVENWRRSLEKLKICFISLGAYPLLSGTNEALIGGAELQQVLLAKELVKANADVSFIVLDHHQKSPEIINDIRIIKSYPVDTPSGIRFLKLYSLWKALDQANADIYFLMWGLAGITSFYSFFKNKKFIYTVASDSAIERKLANPKFYNYYLNKLDIKRADVVIAQTIRQQEVLMRKFRRESIVIKCMHILPDYKPQKNAPSTILWVSTIRRIKQPELFLKLAKELPAYRFQMVGPHALESPEYSEEIQRLASEIPNLEFIGFVPYPEINLYFDRASIFVNTSSFEGFPNTFVQAWARYTPVISLNVDPDGIICKYRLGFHSKRFEQMVEDVKLLLNDERLREEMGMDGRRYVEREHDVKHIRQKYANVFRGLLE